MAMIPLPADFSAFLRSLQEHEVKYLLIGGYAVAYHGYVRATVDMDVWVPKERSNAERLVGALKEFGFDVPELVPELFLVKDRILRLGNPPMRIEISTDIDGVEFGECYEDRVIASWDDIDVSVISLDKLRTNKLASGRLQDLDDLEHLEED